MTSASQNYAQRIKVAKDKTIQALNYLYEQRELHGFFQMTGQSMPKWDAATGLSKIPALWEGLYPEKTHLAHPYGKKEETWRGIDFPESIRQKLKLMRNGYKEDLILVICNAGAQVKVSRPALIKLLKWALASNINPNEFNGRVTGVGLAAYSGQLDLLKVMHASGADMLLEIKPEHYSGKGGNPIGSTLLHRLTEREPRHSEYADLILFLMDVYPNPNPVDSLGNTPLSLASSDFAPLMRDKLAKMEKARLQSLPQPSKGTVEVKRL